MTTLVAEVAEAIKAVANHLIRGERLGADFEKVWDDNVGKLYEFDVRDVIAKTRKQE